ncbi:MAG: lytic transglycosylase domain-containing protein [Clostridiales bacterium]|jgi:soluble lytic murein transglycosylase|nr:lytic transglycosylase domain-containing protein [Clostridiales bacterium]
MKKTSFRGLFAALITVIFVLTSYFAYSAYEKLRYPVKYKDEIDIAARAFGVDENLILSVINIESGFDESATSRAGAVGLMQLMPSTGGYLYQRIYKQDVDKSRLFEPELNIYLGTYYINLLTQRFDGDLYWALAAYNAGERNVASWIAGGVSIDAIPYAETREYIVKFKRVYKKYQRLNKAAKQTQTNKRR